MPALPPVVGVLRMDTIWSDANDNDIENRLFFTFTSSVDPPADQFADAAQVWFTDLSDCAGNWPSNVQLTGARATNLSTDSGADGLYTGSVAGTAGGDYLPAGVATCISFSVARRYRGGKPRNYLPWGTSEMLLNAQRWTDDYIGNAGGEYQNSIDTFVGNVSSEINITQHVNVSYYEGFTVEGGTGGKRAKNISTPRATPLVDVITGHTVVPYPASQRRRNRR